jgi:hypothetical protein
MQSTQSRRDLRLGARVRSRLRRHFRLILALLLGGLAALLVASQLALSPLAEGAIEGRLEEGGGRADVSLGAFPAVRLLFGHGDELKVEASAVRVEFERVELEQLDGFQDVSFDVERVDAGPIAVRSFTLARHGDEPYLLTMTASTTPREVARFVFGPLLGDLVADPMPNEGRAKLPLTLRARIESRDGEPVLRSAEGSLAGIPASSPLGKRLLDELLTRQ